MSGFYDSGVIVKRVREYARSLEDGDLASCMTEVCTRLEAAEAALGRVRALMVNHEVIDDRAVVTARALDTALKGNA